MPPQRHGGTGGIVAPHHHIVDRLRLFLPRREQQDALGGEYLVNAHGERVLRHERGVFERPRVCRASACGEQSDVRGLVGLGVGLVESDVPVFAYAEDLNVGGMRLDGFGIPRALSLKILRHAVRDVGVGGVDVYLGKQIVPHEPLETRLVARIHADILVQIERPDALIAEPAPLVVLRHFFVKGDGGRARGKADDGVRLLFQNLLDLEKSTLCELFPAFNDCKSHNATSKTV